MIYPLWLRLKYWVARRLHWRGLADYDARWWHPDLDDGSRGLAYVHIKWRLRWRGYRCMIDGHLSVKRFVLRRTRTVVLSLYQTYCKRCGCTLHEKIIHEAPVYVKEFKEAPTDEEDQTEAAVSQGQG